MLQPNAKATHVRLYRTCHVQVSQNEDFQIVTAKCSEVNVTVVPDADSAADEEPEEQPIPEQFISSFKAGKLITTAAAHSAA